MNTDDLIAMLSTGVAPVDKHAQAKRFSLAILLGGLGAILIIALLFGVRPDLAVAARTPLFWIKFLLPLSLLCGSLTLLSRLARPGAAVAGRGWGIGLPLIVVWIATAYLLVSAPEGTRLALLLGKTWRVCPFAIAMLSAPGFAAVFWALRGLAPTRLTLTGAVGGLAAGATATLAYCLHCPEMGVPFWGVWYVLGMALPTLAGALLGRVLLRW
jgi:hypothetical protein